MAKEQEYRGSIELSMIIRDKKGNPIGRKEIVSDKGSDICDFFERNSVKKKHKRNKKKAKAATGNQVADALVEIENHVQNIEAKKKQLELENNGRTNL